MKIAHAGPISFIAAPCPSGHDNREPARQFLAPSSVVSGSSAWAGRLAINVLSERSKNSAELHHVARVVQPSEKPSHWTHGGRPRVPCQKSKSSVSLPSLPFWPELLTPNLAEAVVAEATVSAVAEEWLMGSAEAECLTGSPEAVVACRHPEFGGGAGPHGFAGGGGVGPGLGHGGIRGGGPPPGAVGPRMGGMGGRYGGAHGLGNSPRFSSRAESSSRFNRTTERSARSAVNSQRSRSAARPNFREQRSVAAQGSGGRFARNRNESRNVRVSRNRETNSGRNREAARIQR